MDLIDADRCALVLVDFQQRLMPAIDGGARALVSATRLADIAVEMGVPVFGTQQNPEGLGPNDEAIAGRCAQTLTKMHFDACADGLVGLMSRADRNSVSEIVIAGCEAHVCLLQTALGLLRAGLRVWVVADACASRSAANHVLAMQRLQHAGATIVSVEMVAFEWLRSCEHGRFRRVLALLKAPIG